MMTQRDPGGTDLLGKTVKTATSQARTQAAGRFTLRHHFLHDTVSVLLQYVIRYFQLGQVGWQYLLRKSRLLLIEVYSDQFEVHRSAIAQVNQDVEHRVGVLAPRDTHHHLVVLLYHVVIGNSFARVATQALLQFIEFQSFLAG